MLVIVMMIVVMLVVIMCIERAKSMLVSLFNSYSDNEILVDDSRPSSCSAYTVY